MQSIALGVTTPTLNPVHVLQAMLQQDGSPKALLQRAGANVPRLLATAGNRQAAAQCKTMTKVQGRPELGRVLQTTEKKPSSVATSSLPVSCFCWP